MQRSVLQQKLPLLRKEVVICPRRKEPVELVLAKGKKHLSKAEIEERKATEVKVDLVDIKAPSYLTEEQSKEFEELAYKLKHINILSINKNNIRLFFIINAPLSPNISV